MAHWVHCSFGMPTQDEIAAASTDINHPLRHAYIEYVRECRTYGDDPAPFLDWIELEASWERFLNMEAR